MILVAQFWTFVAIVSVAAAIGNAVRTIRFIRRSAVATGTVTEFETASRVTPGSADAHGLAEVEHSQYAKFKFSTADGTWVESRSRVGEWPTSLSTGDEVPIRYDLRNPQDAEIDVWWRLWGAALALAAIGLGAAAAAYLIRGLSAG